MEISRMEAAISTTRHSPMKPTTDGSTNSNSSLVVMLEGESFTLRLPRARTIYIIFKCLLEHTILISLWLNFCVCLQSPSNKSLHNVCRSTTIDDRSQGSLMMKGGHGQTNTLHDHASRAPQLMSCNYCTCACACIFMRMYYTYICTCISQHCHKGPSQEYNDKL